MKTTIKSIFYGFFFILFAAIGIPTDANGQFDYMVKYDTSGKEYWFMITDTDTVAMDGPPAHLIDTIPETPAELPPLEQDNSNPVTVDQLLNKWTVITAGLISLLTFLTGLFPKFTFFQDDRKRDLAAKALGAAIVIGIALVMTDKASAWQVIVSFMLSVFGYNQVLKPAGLNTKTAATPAK